MKIELTKNQKDYLIYFLKDGHLDDLHKDLRRHSMHPSISKDIRKEIKMVKSIVDKLWKD